MDKKDSLVKAIAEIFYEKRATMGISQQELANRCGVSQMTVQRVESAHGGTKIENLIDMADSLQINLGSIFRKFKDPMAVDVKIADQSNQEESEWDKINKKVKKLSQEEREWLSDICVKVLERPRKNVRSSLRQS